MTILNQLKDKAPLWGRLALSALLGALTGFGFAPFGVWPLALLGPGYAAWLALRKAPGAAFGAGFCFGLGAGLSQMYWLINVLVDYGRLAWPLAVLALFVLMCYLALYPALVSGLGAWLKGRGLSPLYCVPLAWTGMELVRGWAITGFPWLPLGNAFSMSPKLLQSAELWGVSGLTFWAALVAALFARALAGGNSPARRGLALGLALAILAGGYLWGGWRQGRIQAAMAKAPKLTTSVVQGNFRIPQIQDPAWHLRMIASQMELSRQARARVGEKKRPWLVVWSESATPFALMRKARPTLAIIRGARELGAGILTGTTGWVKAGGKWRPTNRSWLIGEDGRALGYYDKVHLVPFGEYVPWSRVLFFVRAIAVLGVDQQPGQKGDVITWHGVKLGPLICYESIFPELAREQRLRGAQLIINQTNDGWFGRSVAPAQHMSHLVLRAVETRLAAARSANSGISGFVLPDGTVQGATGLFVPAQVSMDLPLMDMLTPYTRRGDLAGPGALILFVMALALGLWRSRRQKRG